MNSIEGDSSNCASQQSVQIAIAKGNLISFPFSSSVGKWFPFG